MIDEHRKIIQQTIDNAFDIRKEVMDFEINSNFQLLLTQLNLFKVVSGLVVALVGIGYFYNKNLNSDFLFISVVCSLITLILSISYTREIIDIEVEQNNSIKKDIFNKTDEAIKVALKALEENNADIFFNHAREELNKKSESPDMNYIGEIIIFFLYLSLGSLIMSVLSSVFCFELVSFETAVALTGIYLISFKNWAYKVSTLLSKKII